MATFLRIRKLVATMGLAALLALPLSGSIVQAQGQIDPAYDLGDGYVQLPGYWPLASLDNTVPWSLGSAEANSVLLRTREMINSPSAVTFWYDEAEHTATVLFRDGDGVVTLRPTITVRDDDGFPHLYLAAYGVTKQTGEYSYLNVYDPFVATGVSKLTVHLAGNPIGQPQTDAH